MLDKLFNKKDPKSKITKAEDTKKGVSSMRIVAKQTLLFPSMAKQLKSLNNVFSQYLKLHNISPAVPGPISDVKKSLSESKEIKVANIKVKKYGTEKKRTFLAGIVDAIITIIKGIIIGTLLAAGYIVYKLIEIIKPLAESLTNKISEGFTFVSEGIKHFFENVDWLDLIVTSFKKWWSFLSLGLVSEEQLGKAIGEAGSFYKEVVRSIGTFLKMGLEWMAPRLQKVGRFFAKDILGVDVDDLSTKRSIKEVLVENAERIQKEDKALTEEENTLIEKKDKLSHEKKILEKEKEIEEKKKQVEEIEKAPKKAESFLKKLFKKEKKEPLPPVEERSITLPPVEERPVSKPAPVTPAPVTPAPVTPAPTAKPTITTPAPTTKSKPIPELNPGITAPGATTVEKKKEENKDGSGDVGMKYTEGSNVIKIISKYGMRQLPSESEPRLHGGVDYAAALATPITFKGTEGKVALAQFVNGYGRVIDLSVEKEILRFAHLSKMLVKPGDVVKKGDVIGLVGGSGGQNKVDDSAFGPHLHFEHRSKSSWGKANNKDTYDPVKSGAVSLISFGDKIAASDYSVSEKYANYKGEYGEGLSSESSKLALAYREQSKPQNPTVILAGTKNNTVTETKKTRSAVPA